MRREQILFLEVDFVKALSDTYLSITSQVLLLSFCTLDLCHRRGVSFMEFFGLNDHPALEG